MRAKARPSCASRAAIPSSSAAAARRSTSLRASGIPVEVDPRHHGGDGGRGLAADPADASRHLALGDVHLGPCRGRRRSRVRSGRFRSAGQRPRDARRLHGARDRRRAGRQRCSTPAGRRRRRSSPSRASRSRASAASPPRSTCWPTHRGGLGLVGPDAAAHRRGREPRRRRHRRAARARCTRNRIHRKRARPCLASSPPTSALRRRRLSRARRPLGRRDLARRRRRRRCRRR